MNNDTTGTIRTYLIGALDEEGKLCPVSKSDLNSGGSSSNDAASATNQQQIINKLDRSLSDIEAAINSSTGSTNLENVLGEKTDNVNLNSNSNTATAISYLKGFLKELQDIDSRLFAINTNTSAISSRVNLSLSDLIDALNNRYQKQVTTLSAPGVYDIPFAGYRDFTIFYKATKVNSEVSLAVEGSNGNIFDNLSTDRPDKQDTIISADETGSFIGRDFTLETLRINFKSGDAAIAFEIGYQ